MQNNTVQCKAVSAVISRSKGVPTSRAVNLSRSSSLASEEALMGFGLMGTSRRGDAFARVGVYTFRDGAPVFRFPVNYDVDNGRPMFSDKHKLSEPEMSLINWVQGGLFSESVQDGAYFMSIDDINNVDPSEQQIVEKTLAAKNFPSRKTFSGEMDLQQSIDMFSKFLERQDSEHTGIESPSSISLIAPEQVDPNNPNGFEEIMINAAMFKTMVINRFCYGLRAQGPKYRDAKAALLTALDLADKKFSTKANSKSMASIADQSCDVVWSAAKNHLSTLKLKQDDLNNTVKGINMGLHALKVYFKHRNEDNTITMFTPLSDVKVSNPMFTPVSAIPVQVASDYYSDGSFPANGNELFS